MSTVAYRTTLASLLIALIVSGCVRNAQRTATVTVGGQTVTARVARTQVEQAQGLAGTTELSWNEGMLFPFSSKRELIFWMKGMVIPIDIIWIADGRIVGIEENVLLPPVGSSDGVLPTYRSPVPADTVLEVKAGFAAKFGLKVGDLVTWQR